MKTIMKCCLVLLCAFSLAVAVYGADPAVTEVKVDKLNIYFPTANQEKLPLVFFAHNGGGTKEDWGDYPQLLAAEGFLTVSIGWTNQYGCRDIIEDVDYILKNYESQVDVTRVAFIAGCHGGVKMAELMNKEGLPYQIKTAVFLSVSEWITLPEKHVPILGFYATNDRLGAYYKSFTKQLVEEIITQPKKAIAIEGTPHGNELVTDAKTKDSVRQEITSWIKQHLGKSA